MSIINKISNLFNKTKSRTFGVILQTYSGVTQWVDETFKIYAKEGYDKNVYVYSAIRAKSKAIANVSWSVFKKPENAKDDLKKQFNHPIEKLINNPNPYESRFSFISKVEEQLDIFGNCYIEMLTSTSKKTRELYILRADRMSITPNADKRNGLVKEYIYRAEGYDKVIKAKNILHLKRHNPLDDLYGLSPIQVAGMAIDQNNLTKNWNIDILKNGGMPSGYLKTEHPLTDEQVDNLKAQLATYNTTEARGKNLVLEAGLSFDRFSMSSEDMAWVQASKMSAREISIVFGVPPEILGDSTNKTYNNYTQARKAFYEETIIPELEYLTQEIGNWLLKEFEMNNSEYTVTYNKGDIEAIIEDRVMLWDKANASHFITLNEKRNLVGYDDDENGEIYLIPTDVVVVDNLKDLVKLQKQIAELEQTLMNKPQNNVEPKEDDEETQGGGEDA